MSLGDLLITGPSYISDVREEWRRVLVEDDRVRVNHSHVYVDRDEFAFVRGEFGACTMLGEDLAVVLHHPLGMGLLANMRQEYYMDNYASEFVAHRLARLVREYTVHDLGEFTGVVIPPCGGFDDSLDFFYAEMIIDLLQKNGFDRGHAMWPIESTRRIIGFEPAFGSLYAIGWEYPDELTKRGWGFDYGQELSRPELRKFPVEEKTVLDDNLPY